MIASTRTTTGNHRRYRESDVLKVTNGAPPTPRNPETRREVEQQRRSAREARRAFAAQLLGGVTLDPDPPEVLELDRPDHPDHKFTTWDKDVNKARASVDVEALNQKRQALIDADLEAKRKREAANAREVRKKREADWLEQIKRVGIDEARRERLVSGEQIAWRQPPPAVITKAAKALEENINLSTCPLPASGWDFNAKRDAEKLAKACVAEHVEAWVSKEESGALPEVTQQDPGTSLSTVEDDDEEAEWEEDGEEDFDDEWEEEDEDDFAPEEELYDDEEDDEDW